MNTLPFGTLASVATLALAFPAPAFSNDSGYVACVQEHRCRLLSIADLARIRGGFAVQTPTGELQIAIGITRAVSVNGQLVATSQLVLPNLSQLASQARAQADAAIASSGATSQPALPNAAKLSAAANAQANAALAASGISPNEPTASQGGSSNSAGASAQGSSATPSTATSNVASTAGSGGQSVPTVLINGVRVSVQSVLRSALPTQAQGALVLQNGPGNTANLASGFATALPTVIQNTLDNQAIRSATLVNITTNSLSMFRAANLGDLMRNATISFGR